MYTGFPDLPLAPPAAELDPNFELEDEQGCVKNLDLPSARSVRLSYPALCHILALSAAATRSRSVTGRLCGLQVGDEVRVTEVQENPLRRLQNEPQSKEEYEARRQQERKEQARAFAELSDMCHKEELDTYVAGSFVIGSATYSPYQNFLLAQLMDLRVSGQPMTLLYYDPFRTGILGRPYLRAFTPTKAYLRYSEQMQKKNAGGKRSDVVKASKLTKEGVLEEIPISIEVDPFQTLGLAQVAVAPVQDSFRSIQSDAANDYITALIRSATQNTDNLISSLEWEGRVNTKEGNPAAPLAQSVDTLLALGHLREQTAHLEALCDSVLLNTSLLRDL